MSISVPEIEPQDERFNHAERLEVEQRPVGAAVLLLLGFILVQVFPVIGGVVLICAIVKFYGRQTKIVLDQSGLTIINPPERNFRRHKLFPWSDIIEFKIVFGRAYGVIPNAEFIEFSVINRDAKQDGLGGKFFGARRIRLPSDLTMPSHELIHILDARRQFATSAQSVSSWSNINFEH